MSESLVRPGILLVPNGLSSEDEVLSRRTAGSKTYGLGGRQFKVASFVAGAVHYKNEPGNELELWKDVDLTITDVAGEQVVSRAWYDLTVFTDRVGYDYRSKRGGRVIVELAEIDGAPPDYSQLSVRAEGNQLFWDNVAPGLDLKVQLRSMKVEIFKQLRDASSPRRFRWRVSEDISTEANFSRETGGWDAEHHFLEVLTSVSPISLSEFWYDEEWTGRVSVQNHRTRIKEWMDKPVYPVTVDAFTSENLTNTADDGFEWQGDNTWAYAYSSWEAGYYSPAGAPQRHGGLRFQTLGVPQGATITNAVLKMNTRWMDGNPQMRIYADDVNSAVAFANGNLPSGITKTAAFKAWTPGTMYTTTTVGVTAVVQEIISRPGWASGNIRFGLFDQVSSGQNRVFMSDYNQAGATASVLEVTYSTRIPRPPAAYNSLAIY